MLGSGIDAGRVDVIQHRFGETISASSARSAASRISCSMARLDLLQFLFRNAASLRSETAQGGSRGRAWPPAGESLPACRAVRRRKASANTAAPRGHESAPVPCAAARIPPPRPRFVTLGKIRAVAFQRQQMRESCGSGRKSCRPPSARRQARKWRSRCPAPRKSTGSLRPLA